MWLYGYGDFLTFRRSQNGGFIGGKGQGPDGPRVQTVQTADGYLALMADRFSVSTRATRARAATQFVLQQSWAGEEKTKTGSFPSGRVIVPYARSRQRL